MVSVLALVACSSGGRGTSGGGGGGGGGDVCDPECGSGQLCCPQPSGLTCTNPQVSPNHCGGCNRPCAGACVDGVCQAGLGDSGMVPDGTLPPTGDCTPECSSSQRCCGSSCVNRESSASDGRMDPSFQNCNGCGFTCDPERANRCGRAGGGMIQCLCGAGPQCVGTRVCVNNGGTNSCVDLNSDRNNCGEAGNVCNDGETCVGGMCRCGGAAPCGSGQSCCAGSCISTDTDALNCGGCGVSCGANAPNCEAGACICRSAGRACREAAMGGGGLPLPIPVPGGDLGESCCTAGCVPNTAASCNCSPCAEGSMCIAPISLPLPIPGMMAGSVCCSSSGILCD